MKRKYLIVVGIILLIIGLIIAIIILSKKDTKLKDDENTIVDIRRNSNVCDDAIEEFHVDREFKYYFPCIMAEDLKVEFSDGNVLDFLDVFPDDIKLSDLDEHDIHYITEETISEVGIEVNLPIENTDIVLDVYEVEDGILKIEITNMSDITYLYGENYFLQVYVNGEWHELLTNHFIYFNNIGYNIESNQISEIEVDYYYGYGRLDKGTYRVVKDFNYHDDSYYVFGEFEIN